MTRISSAFSIVGVALVAACAGAPANDPTGTPNRNVATLPTTITLAPGASVEVAQANLAIRFDSVTSDSRCPTDVQCVHAGWATVALTAWQLSGTMSAQLLSLSTTAGKDSATGYGKPLKLLSVTPAPRSTAPIAKSAYRIELLVGAPK
ncbi:MAG: hypothetical protein H7Z40_01325 [Phycisphaerae bacterium]|nr:hypothetical protein [Gemmatimonadaceae bacterium]